MMCGGGGLFFLFYCVGGGADVRVSPAAHTLLPFSCPPFFFIFALCDSVCVLWDEKLKTG